MSVADKNELKILKVQVKTWELEFFRLNSRKPSKEDIHHAPTDIKDAYRNYWKMKSKIESVKDDVWNESFNKCNHKSRNTTRQDSIQTFCDKLKQKSNIASNKNESPIQICKDIIRTYKKNCITHTSDFMFLNRTSVNDCKGIENSVNTSEDSANNDNSIPIICTFSEDNSQTVNQHPVKLREIEVNSEVKIEMEKTPARFIKSHDIYKKSSSVNILFSSINLTDSAKKMHFKQDIDEKWLQRCNQNILKEPHKIAAPKCETDKSREKVSDISSTDNKFSEFSTVYNNDLKTSHSTKIHSEYTQNVDLKLNGLQSSTNTRSASVNDKNENSNLHNSVSEITTSEESNFSLNQLCDINDKEQIMMIEQSCQDKSGSELAKEETDDEAQGRKSKKRKLSSTTHTTSPSTSYKANHLKRKIAAGTLNENFVSLVIKKKRFSRGHRPVNVRKMKWNKWKQMKKNSVGGGNVPGSVTGCFKCGQLGHWARQCNASTAQKDNTFLEEENVDDIPLPTLEEAAKLAEEVHFNSSANKSSASQVTTRNKSVENKPSKDASFKDSTENEKKETIPDANCYGDLFNIDEADLPTDVMKPLYETEKGKPISTPTAVYDTLKEMGYSEFREGQESAIMRVLCGLSTLVVLPTGSGKSLCYQLPAYMYAKHSKSLALVVSPLVSLMEDQVTGLPSCLHAVCLHSGMTDVQKSNAMKDITGGLAQILLVSPEAIIGGRGFSDTILNSSMPPISFVCIDEVHCISQWSHNFRPSYLQLYKVLTKKMGIKCILGLTATATQSAIEDIISSLDLKCVDESVVGCTNIPQNLHLSVSRDKDKDRLIPPVALNVIYADSRNIKYISVVVHAGNKIIVEYDSLKRFDKALIQLLSGDRFRQCASIIIYCIRRNETERLAALIRTCLQDDLKPEDEQMTKKKKAKSKKRSFAWTAEAYHAGLPPPRRRSIQKQFMSGKLRIVIATVAFGMGLDKPDVRAIIHYNMPKNFEGYVQEIGRAGRDGLVSHCHLFLDSEGNDLWEQQRHIFSNSIDRHTLRKLLRRVFVPCKCSSTKMSINDSETIETSKNICPKHEVAFPINETVQELDVKQENISTLLCYLELHSKQWIEILPPAYATCAIRCYGGAKQMHAIALKNPAIATAIALDAENGKKWNKSSNLTFPVVKVASTIGWKSSQLKHQLKQLEWNDMKRKTGVMVEFSDLAFHVSAPGNLSGEELDEVLDFLYNKVMRTEQTELKNLKSLFSVFQKYSFPRYWECCDEVNTEFSDGIKAAINKYFARSDLLFSELKEIEDKTPDESRNEVDMPYVKSLIRDLIGTHHDQNFTGRAIARIFHGIASPCFPSEVWGKVRKFWRCLLHVNFNTILKLANEELRNLK